MVGIGTPYCNKCGEECSGLTNNLCYMCKNNWKIYFRIPFTEYFVGREIKLCLFRKVFVNGVYQFTKI